MTAEPPPNDPDERLRRAGLDVLVRDGGAVDLVRAIEDDPAAGLCLFGGDEILKRAGRFLDRLRDELHPGEGQTARTGDGHATITVPGTQAGDAGGDGGQDTVTGNGQTMRTPTAARVPVRRHSRTKPGHARQRSRVARKAVATVVAKTAFDRYQIRGRSLGDVLYGEIERAAELSVDAGISHLKEAFLLKRLFRSVPFNPALRDVPVRDWAEEAELVAAEQRWADLEQKMPRLTLAELDDVLAIEHAPA